MGVADTISVETMPIEESRNPVRRDAQRVMEHAEYVSVNRSEVENLAEELVGEYDFELASWDAPVYPTTEEHPVEDVIDFIMVGNSVNYAFNDLETGEKYTTEYLGTEWRGSFGMWAALRRAYDSGTPILNHEYLQDISREDVETIFEPAGDTELPAMSTRVEQLRAVGELMWSFGGTFAGAFNGTFTDGDSDSVTLYGDSGLVSELASSEAYRDDTTYNDQSVRFDKRAQLTVSMLYGKLRETPYAFTIDDMDSFTVFADYGIPAALDTHGVLEYDAELASKVEAGEVIEAGSPMEVEIRAGTVVAGDLLQEELETEHGVDVTVPVLDFALWQMRTDAETNPHLTKTTAY